MKLKTVLSMAVSAVLIATAAPGASITSTAAVNSSMRDMTTMEIVTDMGIGINLGNTFESCGDWIDQWGDGTPNAYETAWGSPTVTRDMIQGYADAGFGVVRIDRREGVAVVDRPAVRLPAVQHVPRRKRPLCC